MILMKTTHKLAEKINVALDKMNFRGKEAVTYLVSPKEDITVYALSNVHVKVYSKDTYYKLTILTAKPSESSSTLEDLEFWVASPSGSGKFSKAELLDLFEHVKKKSVLGGRKL